MMAGMAPPTLLFLHGVGSGDRSDGWRRALDAGLRAAGHPGLAGVDVLAPQYPDVLRRAGSAAPVPPVTVADLPRDEARRHRRAVERRTSALEHLVGLHDGGSGWPGAYDVVDIALAVGPFSQAHHYLTEPGVRAQVLRQVLASVPPAGRLLIVGHSLGSVIAADLVRRLPPDVEVVGLVTIGSPLGHTRFDVEDLVAGLATPPANLGWWLNCWNELDPVTSHRGVSAVVPWVLDRRVQAPFVADPHAAVNYLSDPTVVVALGFALFGSGARDLGTPERGADVPLDPVETVALVALHHAHLTRDQLVRVRRQRYEDALRNIQASAVDAAARRRTDLGSVVPRDVAACAVDLGNPASTAPRPPALHHLSKEEAVVPLVFVATTNVIRPYEIEVPAEVRTRALQHLTASMGLGSAFGADVVVALARAREVVGGGAGDWVTRTALGMGAGALLAAAGGFVLAATPVGTAAEAATALVPFEPDGVLGELLSAASVAASAGGGVAHGLAGAGIPAEAVESVVEAQLAAALLREMHDLDQDPATWHGLVGTGAELRRELARLAPVSDRDSQVVEQARRKLLAVDRGLDHLLARGLEPASVRGSRGRRG